MHSVQIRSIQPKDVSNSMSFVSSNFVVLLNCDIALSMIVFNLQSNCGLPVLRW